jgi:hypothetical protein
MVYGDKKKNLQTATDLRDRKIFSDRLVVL